MQSIMQYMIIDACILCYLYISVEAAYTDIEYFESSYFVQIDCMERLSFGGRYNNINGAMQMQRSVILYNYREVV